MLAANGIAPPTAALMAASPLPPRKPRRLTSGLAAEDERVGPLRIVLIKLVDGSFVPGHGDHLPWFNFLFFAKFKGKSCH